MKIIDQIETFLIQNGAGKLSAEMAIVRIKLALFSNRHFVTSASEPKAFTHGGFLRVFKCKIEAVFPDEGVTKSGFLRYDYRPSLKNQHKVKITFN